MPNEIQIIQISQVVCSLFVNNYISLSLSHSSLRLAMKFDSSFSSLEYLKWVTHLQHINDLDVG